MSFRFIDRWQTSLREGLSDRPERDRLLAILENRDLMLENHLAAETTARLDGDALFTAHLSRAKVIMTDDPQTIATATTTNIVWSSEISDVDNWAAPFTAGVTVPAGKAGQYLVTCSGVWNGGPGADNALGCAVNGAIAYEAPTANGVFWVSTLTFVRTLAVGDVLTFRCYQSSGLDKTFTGRLEIAWVGA